MTKDTIQHERHPDTTDRATPPDHPEKAGAESPHLDAGEKDQAAQHTAPHALMLHEIVREEGEAALERTVIALVWSSLAAGLSMGFSFLTTAVLQAGLPDTSWRHLVSSFGYTTGFVLVIMGRQQLFSESTLTVVLPVLTRRDLDCLLKALRLWIVVLFCNLLSSWAFAAMLRLPGVFEADVVDALDETARSAVGPANTFPTFIRAVLGGWLIALMVWLLPSARSARLLTVVLITWVVAVAKLSHIIAGSTEVAYAVLAGDASLADYFGRFLLPTLAGNVVGGMTLVALLNHAAIAPEISERR
ncbi:formate/nitrite transporter family protein [Paraburkholderia terrae]|jgi:formate/nitrite transporter FocA (FNT family)|uniref:formate/nitrite transporter family protein n=1 Tax=Paraburkholderia TaxID=1822464 RepID=UPI0009A6AAC1|nr:formate/nitrite transporter family protein [Paraburkholderia hospita]SKC73280.1 Formate/nitrite transporter FocA, FNT family [Paraburkholderia hospita]SKC75451.1 Formate/nitrite transporter FocA, FNT family [Burkholderia sp. CF099]SOE46626.1 Formate/nitrite transporter FocA, FNT family [Burkholderia sp. YR290]